MVFTIRETNPFILKDVQNVVETLHVEGIQCLREVLGIFVDCCFRQGICQNFDSSGVCYDDFRGKIIALELAPRLRIAICVIVLLMSGNIVHTITYLLGVAFTVPDDIMDMSADRCHLVL